MSGVGRFAGAARSARAPQAEDAVVALLVGRLLESQLVGVTPRDPAALAAAVLALGAAGLVAIWRPARRAAATDPAIALRAEQARITAM